MHEQKIKHLEGGVRTGKAIMAIAEIESLVPDGVLKTSIIGNLGILIVSDCTNSKVALLRIEGNTVVSVSANAIFSITKDTASKLNVYWETDQIKVQNKTSANVTLKVALVGV
jgi:formylmethanofuran dehydrogenase subunit E